jgi:hypothetical protein
MVCAVYVPLEAARLHPLDWYVFDYGALLSTLPGVVLTVVFAPQVAYRRRDALALLFPPAGIRLAWIIGTRLGQLPDRDWPARTNGIELQSRQAVRIVAAVNNYRRLRQKWSRGHRSEVPPPLAPATPPVVPRSDFPGQPPSWRQKWSRGDRTKPGLRS